MSKTDITNEEVEQIRQEKEYWQELAEIIGWKVSGWTYKNNVTYITKEIGGYEISIHMTGSQRDDIMRAIEKACERCHD